MARVRVHRGLMTWFLKLLIGVVFLGPMLLALESAFRRNAEIFKYSGTLTLRTLLPIPFTFTDFGLAVHRPEFLRQVLNTLVLGLVQSSLTVVLALLAAFALARLKFPGRGGVFYLLIATMFIPLEALAVPLFLVVKNLGQLNSFWGLLLPWVAGPGATYILRQAIADVPRSLDEAVMIDGGGVVRILRHVIVPSVWPAMITVWLITFIYIWDSFLWPLIIISDPRKQLVQIGIVSLINPNEVQYGTLFAMSVIAAAPVVAIFLMLQRFYQQGVATTGLK
jgi:ABC-type glycerol-3-phosphate transport system permease component